MLAFENLGPVLAISGAVGGSCLAYIGPGMVYLGVHGGRFLQLVQESWLGSKLLASPYATVVDPNNSTSQASRRAVETTLLVAGGTVQAATVVNEDDVAKKQESSRKELEEESMLVYAVKTIVWYTSGMPVWCFIAATGRQGLTSHIHEMGLKSPHPIRIGDVEYKRVRILQGRVDADPEDGRAVLAPKGLMRQDSLPLVATTGGKTTYGRNRLPLISIKELVKTCCKNKNRIKTSKRLSKRTLKKNHRRGTISLWMNGGFSSTTRSILVLS
jgi:hypothetical protein